MSTQRRSAVPISKKGVEKHLRVVAEMLPLTLNTVLKRFKPDKYMKSRLKGYLPVWGDRPVIDFVRGVVSSGHAGDPDIWNGDMKPFNVLQVLDIICRAEV